MECSKENVKIIKTYFSVNSLKPPFKDINGFLKDILSGPFTVEHTSKFRFLVIMKNTIDQDFSLLGGDKREDCATYPHAALFSFAINAKFVQEITEDKAKKLNDIVSVFESGENVNKLEVKSVKKVKKKK